MKKEIFNEVSNMESLIDFLDNEQEQVEHNSFLELNEDYFMDDFTFRQKKRECQLPSPFIIQFSLVYEDEDEDKEKNN